MKSRHIIVLLCGLMILSVACADNPEHNRRVNDTARPGAAASPPATSSPAPIDEFAAARAMFNATCVNCHKRDGEGGVANFGGGEKLEVPSFKTGRRLTDSDEALAKQIADGGGGMPAFGKRLTPEQINGLVRFVRHEFQQGLGKQ